MPHGFAIIQYLDGPGVRADRAPDTMYPTTPAFHRALARVEGTSP